MNNETEFKASEISCLKEILGLSSEERDAIFLQTRLNIRQPREEQNH